MALLLDDDEVLVATVTASREPGHVPSLAPAHDLLAADRDARVNESLSPCATASSCRAREHAPSTAAAAPHGECSAVSACITVTMPREGGNGMKKMEALLFGKSKVALVCDGTVPCRKRFADEAFGTAVEPKHVLQKTSLAPACDGSTDSTCTQPKVVSAARSLSSASLQREKPSTPSWETMPLTPHERSSHVAVSTSPEHQVGSPAASPPARRPPTHSSMAREETAAEIPASPATKEPAKMQMKLSDFFSKMACKR
ncbi:hypothetical protein LSCM4_02839 [Leishmania orientalis]|uniref:Uncharacterized protein n=1 Tax=Leishmania orientalis TaxID=2249476 RepID=A0A836GQV9_9TRYP|nr:hypothetical protein LSCM4_02839 [Leishmania orientalis]